MTAAAPAFCYIPRIIRLPGQCCKRYVQETTTSDFFVFFMCFSNTASVIRSYHVRSLKPCRTKEKKPGKEKAYQECVIWPALRKPSQRVLTCFNFKLAF